MKKQLQRIAVLLFAILLMLSAFLITNLSMIIFLFSLFVGVLGLALVFEKKSQ